MAVLSRRKWAEEIARSIGLDPSNIVYDNRGFSGGGDAWYNARRIWTMPAEDCSHRLVLQDDIICCDDFLHYVNIAVDKYPNCVWTFYNGVWIPQSCKKLNTPYCKVRGNKVGGPALLMPVEMAHDMVSYTDAILGADFKHDDGRIGFYALAKGIDTMCCIPSLVQHKNEGTVIPHHGGKGRVSSTFQQNVSRETWDSTEINYSPFVANTMWLPKDHPRKAYVERVIRNAKSKKA